MESKALTARECQEIEKRTEAATPGPWSVEPAEYEQYTDPLDGQPALECYQAAQIPEILTLKLDDGWFPNETDQGFIAHARADVPALLASYRAAMELLKEFATVVQSTEKPLNSCIIMSQIHDAPYTGPNWGAQLEKALAKVADYEAAAPESAEGGR